ncbi:hypothetical protein VUR80DRAFT_8596 [Thermomyces stellatus]
MVLRTRKHCPRSSRDSTRAALKAIGRINFNGAIYGEDVLPSGAARPFLLIALAGHPFDLDISWVEFTGKTLSGGTCLM